MSFHYVYVKVWPLSVWDHRRGVGDSFCARPQPAVEDAGTQQRWDRSDEAKVSCNFSLSLSIFRYAFELLDDSQCSPLAEHQYCSSAPTSKSISVKGWRKQFLSSPPHCLSTRVTRRCIAIPANEHLRHLWHNLFIRLALRKNAELYMPGQVEGTIEKTTMHFFNVYNAERGF